MLELILAYPNCDVDLPNRMERATPLHCAAKIEDDDLRLHVIQSLMEAGCDPKYVPSLLLLNWDGTMHG